MQRRASVLLLVLTIVSVPFACVRLAAAQGGPPDRSADTAAIRKQIEDICQAFVDKDRPTLEATHGKDWRGFTPFNDHVMMMHVWVKQGGSWHLAAHQTTKVP